MIYNIGFGRNIWPSVEVEGEFARETAIVKVIGGRPSPAATSNWKMLRSLWFRNLAIFMTRTLSRFRPRATSLDTSAGQTPSAFSSLSTGSRQAAR